MANAFKVLVLSFVSGAIVIGVGASIKGAQEKPFTAHKKQHNQKIKTQPCRAS